MRAMALQEPRCYAIANQSSQSIRYPSVQNPNYQSIRSNQKTTNPLASVWIVIATSHLYHQRFMTEGNWKSSPKRIRRYSCSKEVLWVSNSLSHPSSLFIPEISSINFLIAHILHPWYSQCLSVNFCNKSPLSLWRNFKKIHWHTGRFSTKLSCFLLLRFLKASFSVSIHFWISVCNFPSSVIKFLVELQFCSCLVLTSFSWHSSTDSFPNNHSVCLLLFSLIEWFQKAFLVIRIYHFEKKMSPFQEKKVNEHSLWMWLLHNIPIQSVVVYMRLG